MTAQMLPMTANTQVHIHPLAKDFLYIGKIETNIPRSCKVEFWTRSQKSTSLIEPGMSSALLQARTTGMMQIQTPKHTTATRVGLR